MFGELRAGPAGSINRLKITAFSPRTTYSPPAKTAPVVKFKALIQRHLLGPLPGALLVIGCGLWLWSAPPGEHWVNGSYDYLFRFGARPVTNSVAVVLMDNEAHDQLQQTRGLPWDRGLHAQLLRKLAADDCALVVFDSFFRETNDSEKDTALAEAMRQQCRVVLMARQTDLAHPDIDGVRFMLPAELFLNAARSNCGVAWLTPDLDSVVRKHWPFPSPGPHPSLSWTAAELAGARLDPESRERWIRYYGANGPWANLSYGFALNQAPGYFRGKIVFVGNQPATTMVDNEPDKFVTPFTQRTGEATGGVQIMTTIFLNLLNDDWLRRPPPWLEALGLVASGTLLVFGLRGRRALTASVIAIAAAITVALGAVSWSHWTNYWFPWLVIAGGQVPCALAWTLATQRARRPVEVPVPLRSGNLPETPDYELIDPPFGQGAYGKVWLARNAIGQWQALKVVYLENFGQNTDPYEREFSGIKRYKPISNKHPGLLRVDFVSNRKAEGYFYYVMELGDALDGGWETQPSTYKPRDLASERNRAPGRRLPVRECVRIGLALSEALEFLHQQGLTHRDIKLQNIILVDGQPKLADVGLVSEIRPPETDGTYLGTPGYMPPPPEVPGSPQADIYALGMVLYASSTGNNPAYFPDLATILVDGKGHANFIRLNAIVLKACNPDRELRYTSAGEMHRDLQDLHRFLETDPPTPVG
jgi:CHASE2 domain-containing sensor protein